MRHSSLQTQQAKAHSLACYPSPLSGDLKEILDNSLRKTALPGLVAENIP